MKTFVKNTVLATMMGAGLMTCLPMTASADDFSFGMIIGGGPEVPGDREVFLGDDPGFRNGPRGDDPRYRPRGDDRRYFGNQGGDEVYRRRPRGGCDPEEAVDIARDYGLRRPGVVSIDRRKLVVEGRQHGGRARIIFGNVPGCPVAYR